LPATSIDPDPQRLARLVGLGYEAPATFGSTPGGPGSSTGKDGWRLFAEEAAEAFGCQLAMVEYQAPATPERSFIVAGGLDGFEDVFCQARSLNAADTYLDRMLGKPEGTVLLGMEIVPPDQMRRSTSYSRLAMPWHLEHFLMGTIVSDEGGSAFFSLGRAAREQPFVEGDKSLVGRLLLSHLTRSMSVQREMAAIRSANALLTSVMCQSPTGLVVFDLQGRPVFINQKASAILAAGDGLALVNGELVADNPLARMQLRQGLSSILQAARGRPVPAPPTVLVARPSGAQPYRVSFSAVGPPGGGGDLPRGSAVVATIHDERRSTSATVPAVFRTTYGLTRAEVRLCEALLAGDSLVEAANALNVSRNTAKTHLARIFDKTGVRSQVALLRLLTLGGRT
jgi:DNA-binding CsgD family transcriptional regulator